MRPAQFTDGDIISAGKEIRDTGRLVTPFGIRNILGGGNTTRIREVWDRFLENERDEPEDIEQPQEPATLPPQLHEHALQAKKTLTGFIDGLYMQAYTLVETDLSQRYKRDFEALKTQQTAAESALEDAGRSVETADKAIFELTAERDELRGKLDEVRAEKAGLEADLRGVRGDLEDAEAEVDRLTGENAVLAKTSMEAQKAQASAQAASAEKDKSITRLEDDLKAARTAAKIAEKDAETARTALALRVAELTRAQTDLEAEQAKHERVQEVLAKLDRDFENAKVELDRTQKDLAQRDRDLEDAKVELESGKRTIGELRGVMDRQGADLKARTLELSALQRQIEEVTSKQVTIAEMRDLLLDQIRQSTVAETGQQGDTGDDQAPQS